MIKLQDFANQCGVTDRAIQKHLKNHEKELEGHFSRRGPNGTWLDEYAQDYIRQFMKIAPIVINDKSLVDENADLKNTLEDLRRKYDEQTAAFTKLSEWKSDNAVLIAQAQADQKLLAQANQNLQAANRKIEMISTERDDLRSKAVEAGVKVNMLESEKEVLELEIERLRGIVEEQREELDRPLSFLEWFKLKRK